MSRGTGIPGALARVNNALRSRCLFHWRAADASLAALTGQSGALTRAGNHGAALDRRGALWRPPHSLPAWDTIDIDGDGIGDELGLLIEGSLSNVVSNPEDLGNAAWTKTNVTVSTVNLPGLFGAASMQALMETAANGVHFASSAAITITAGEYVFLSAVVAPNGRTRGQVYADIGGADRIGANFDLAAGTASIYAFGAGATSGVGIIPLADGRFYVYAAGKINAGGTSAAAVVRLFDAAGTSSYAGDTTKGLLVGAVQLLRCGTIGPTAQRYVGGSGAGPFSRTADAFAFAGAGAWPMQDFTLYARLARPPWADWTGTLRSTRYLFRLGNANPSCDLYCNDTTRQFEVSIGDGSTFTTARANIPAGRVLDVAAQVSGWRTGGSVAIDAGGGLSAFSTPLPAPVIAPSSTTIALGGANAAGFELDGTLIAVKVAGGLRTLTDMRQIL